MCFCLQLPLAISFTILVMAEYWWAALEWALWLLTCATAGFDYQVIDREPVRSTANGLDELQFAYVCTIYTQCKSTINLFTSAVICKQLSDIDNGAVSQKNPAVAGSVAAYTCRRGFKLIGSSRRVCQSNGPRNPYYYRRSCGNPGTPKNVYS